MNQTTLENILITFKKRGKTGRFLVAKSISALDFIFKLELFAIPEVKISWYDKVFKTQKYLKFIEARAYNTATNDVLEVVYEKIDKLCKEK